LKPMKSWQSILINGCITVVAVFVANNIFVPDAPPDKTKEIPEALNAQIKNIQLKLNAIEEGLSNQKVATNPSSGKPTKGLENLQKLDRKLDMVIGKISFLEKKIDDIQLAPASKPSYPTAIPGQREMGTQRGGANPAGWLDNISATKRSEVEVVFEENANRIREKLPPGPDGQLPDPELMQEVMEESDRELKEELKRVLSEEEYQSFLDSLPKPFSIKDPALPGS
jgi:hypothetical protein